ncbi:hypothetical protein GGR51DRAFT_537488 [Nemania sp. FL0031]|nr:hypothetical protein GGR51DRAFT_537488 [Nemania sp. FL0031]
MPSHHSSHLHPSKAQDTQYHPPPLSYQFSLSKLKILQKQLAKPYLSNDDLARLEIRCTDLEFDPTLCPPDADALLTLMPAEEMEKLAQNHGFSSIRDLGSPSQNNFNESDRLSERIDTYLSQSEQPEERNSPYLLQKSVWTIREPESFEAPLLGCFRYNINRLFLVTYMLHVRDRSSSHVTCILIEDAPLQEDVLMFSEVWAILSVAGFYFNRPENIEYKIIPVTVVSISRRKVRIVQGYADGEKGIINIRKTRLVDLGDGEDPAKSHNWEFMTIMRWVLARPCGKTT